jgi:hypothetical protein
MRHARWLLLLPTAVCAWQRAPDARAVRALAAQGKLDQAIETARAGGAPLDAVLGEVLVMRGRLVAADSALQRAGASRSDDRRSAEATHAELAELRAQRRAAK